MQDQLLPEVCAIQGRWPTALNCVFELCILPLALVYKCSVPLILPSFHAPVYLSPSLRAQETRHKENTHHNNHRDYDNDW